MSVVCQEIINAMEILAPKFIAEKWDNVGLLIGSSSKLISSVLVTLDVRPEVVDEAIYRKAELIISHHPVIFESMKSMNSDTPHGKMLTKLVQHGIQVYSLHTNLDSSEGGINDVLAQKLSLKNIRPLSVGYVEELFKLIVYVPLSHLDVVRKELFAAGAGHIGNYSNCTFASRGTGSFMPLRGTNPFIGKENKLEFVDEYRLETIVPSSLLQLVIHRMKLVHPYEEVAYDIFPLKNPGKTYGLGRIGELSNACSLEQFCLLIKKVLNISVLKVSGNVDRVKTVAVCGGSGMSLLPEVIKAGVDVFITGDVKYHDAQEASDKGIVVLDAGHFATEQIIIPILENYLKQHSNEKLWGIDISVSGKNKDVFYYI